MLTRLKVNGFKNLIGVDLHFGPFTCIAGANAVGKSNLFDAILFLRSLMEMPIMDAAMAVRAERGSVSDIHHLFTQTAKGICLPIKIEAEMLVPGEGSDYLDQPAEAKTTFLVYRVELRYRSGDGNTTRPRVELAAESLEYVRRTEARAHLPFEHSGAWRESVVKGRRTSPYISTDTQEGSLNEETESVSRVVKLHQDTSTGGGRTRLFQAEKLPRTVLSTVNAQESPTAVLARQEMLNWRLLQLEPSALRAPDGFDAPTQFAANGAHLPATLYRLSRQRVADARAKMTPAEIVRDMQMLPSRREELALAEVSNRLFELIDHVGQVRIDRDEKRELLTLMLGDRHGTELPAKSLSDGTLRFLALASIEIDPTLTGLICMEEPENGIHPERIAAMIGLLRDIAVEPTLPTGEDNPLRQVIITTHSPVVVSQVPDDTVIFAVPEQQVVQGSIVKGVGFRCMSGTWRSDKSKMPVIAKGKAISFLQPIAEKSDTSRKGANRRVVDREDLQLNLDF
jgi:predicted ATPase